MWAPASTWASVSLSTVEKSPAAISAASFFRPVGLIRSPMMQNGRSKPMTTVLVAELITVSVMFLFPRCGRRTRAPAAPLQDARCLDDLRHELFLPVGHDVDAMHALDLADLLDQLDAQALAFGFLLLGRAGLLDPLDHRVGDVHPRHGRAHPARRLGRGQGADAHQDEALLVQPLLAHPLHEPPQQRHVVAVLGLHELGPGRDLLGEMDRPVVERRHERVDRGADEHLRRRGDLAAGEESAFVAHGADGMQEADAVEIEDRLGLGLVAALHPVAGQAQDVGDAHGGGAQHVALDRDPVLVAAGDLHDHGIAGAGQERRCRRSTCGRGRPRHRPR